MANEEEVVAMTRECEERNKLSVGSTRKHHHRKEVRHKLETDVNQGEKERSVIHVNSLAEVSACWHYKSYKMLQLQRAYKVLCANLRIHKGFIYSFFSKTNYHNQ